MYRIFATLALLSLAACWSPPPASRRFALTPTVILSEVLSDPTVTGNNEYVELQCTPGADLSSYWFVIVEGDLNNSAPNERGLVKIRLPLTGISCGANGFVVLQKGGVYDEESMATYADDFFSADLENGSQTYMITDLDPGAGTDLDGTDNDGVLNDATFGSHIIDCIAFVDEDTSDRAYCPAVPNVTDTTGAISRFAGTTTTNNESWYFGDVKDADPDPHYTYDPPSVSANFPAGAQLTPGSANATDPSPPDLAGDFSMPSTDLATGAAADLTGGAPADDLTGAGPTDDLVGAGPTDDLVGGTVDEDLAEPTTAPDLRRPRDLAAPTDLTEEPPADAPDLADGTTTGRDKGGCDCSTPPGPPDPAALFAAAGLLAILRRRRHA